MALHITLSHVSALSAPLYLERGLQVGKFVDVDVAHAISMAQHRDLGVVLDVANQRVAAPRVVLAAVNCDAD